MCKEKYLVSYVSNPHKLLLEKKRLSLQLFKLSCKYFDILQMLIQLYMPFSLCGVSDILHRGDGSYNSAVQAHNFQNDSRKIMSQ